MFVLCFFGAGFGTSSAHADGQAGEAAAVQENDEAVYRLDVGDGIRVIVFGEAELSGEYTVSGDGVIAVPLVGEVPIKGLTLRAAEMLLTEKLSDGYLVDPSVSLEITKHRPFYILGEVRVPGSYSYVNNMTVLNAVAVAGGFTYRANRKTVEVMESDQSDPARYEKRPVESKVLPGEVIVVKERFF